MPITIAATGHRPHKLGYSTEEQLANLIEQYLTRHSPQRAISGMAIGWDMIFAETALKMNIPLICAIPFIDQPARWPSHLVARWAKIKRAATEIHVISPIYSLAAFQRRNEWMVDHADRICALWNGSAGGTANCIRYAHEKGKPVDNLWS